MTPLDDSADTDLSAGFDPPFEVLAPARQTLALVLASPHSGSVYPPAFVAASRLAACALRRSEDSFVDELFGGAPALGAPLIRARFPRALVDCNREPWELDPAMFADPLPDWVNTASPRVRAGLGTLARVVANGEEIYARKLRFAEAKRMVERCHAPYHQALKGLVDATRARFGMAVLIDCHSMPSVGGPMERDAGAGRVDVVLGDCHGSSCAPSVTALAEGTLQSLGLRVTRNVPYAGGFTTRHYGRPREGIHALQIELNRALYMDEAAMRPGPGFAAVAARMGRLIGALGGLGGVALAAE